MCCEAPLKSLHTHSLHTFIMPILYATFMCKFLIKKIIFCSKKKILLNDNNNLLNLNSNLMTTGEISS